MSVELVVKAAKLISAVGHERANLIHEMMQELLRLLQPRVPSEAVGVRVATKHQLNGHKWPIRKAGQPCMQCRIPYSRRLANKHETCYASNKRPSATQAPSITDTGSILDLG